MRRVPALALAVSAVSVLWPALAAAAPVRGTIVLAPENRHVDVRPLAYWRVDNGRLPIAAAPHALAAAVVVFEPEKPVPTKPGKATVEIKGVALEPRVAIAPTGSTFDFVNHDRVSRTLYLEDGENYMPREAIAPDAARQVKFGLPGEYKVRDADYPHANASVLVVATPYFARVDESGAFHLDVPEGRYRLRAWVGGVWSTVDAVQVGVHPIDIVKRFVPDKTASTVAGRAGEP